MCVCTVYVWEVHIKAHRQRRLSVSAFLDLHLTLNRSISASCFTSSCVCASCHCLLPPSQSILDTAFVTFAQK